MTELNGKSVMFESRSEPRGFLKGSVYEAYKFDRVSKKIKK